MYYDCVYNRIQPAFCDDFVVNLTCPVPRCEKRLKQTCISFERSKYSKCVAWRHFYALRESWATRIEYINFWRRSSKINRAVAIFNFNWWITDSPIQITIHENRHFTLMTELLTFTIYFAFLCKPIWGNASVSRYYCNLLSFPLSWNFWGNGVPKKYLEERRSSAFRVPPRLHHLRRLLFSNP